MCLNLGSWLALCCAFAPPAGFPAHPRSPCPSRAQVLITWCAPPLQADRVEAVAVADKAQRLPTDLLAFLRPVGVMEMRFTRMLSSLCALTYDMPALTVRAAVCIA